MSGVGSGLGELSYGSYYLPALAFGYMSSLPHTDLTRLSEGWALTGLHVNVQTYLIALTLISFLGAMEAHGIGRAIYGPSGPVERPKKSVVQVHHTVAIIFGKHENPMEVPKLPAQIADIGYLPVLFDYLRCRFQEWLGKSEEFEWGADILKETFGPVPEQHILSRGWKAYEELVGMISVVVLLRILYFLPMGILKYLTWASFWSLVGFLYKGGFSYAIMLLLFAHVILLLRGWFWKPIPSYNNPDAMNDVFVPEYRMGEKMELEHQSQLDSQKYN